MDEILQKLGRCVEVGKIDKASPYPPDMKGQDGADELAIRQTMATRSLRNHKLPAKW